MKPRDWFFVGLRLLGVWMLLEAIAEGVVYIEAMQGWETLSRSTTNVYVFHGIVDLVVGLGLILLAPGLTLILDWTPLSYGRNECKNCGYDLRGSQDKCPECGQIRTDPPPSPH